MRGPLGDRQSWKVLVVSGQVFGGFKATQLVLFSSLGNLQGPGICDISGEGSWSVKRGLCTCV